MRYSRWSKKGAWQQVVDTLADDPDLEQLMIDSSIVRVHQHGAAKKTAQDTEAMGKSRGGLSTKIHAVGAEPVIPPRKNRQERPEIDWHCYKDRNLVERFFQKIKQFRRVATRYERLARNYQSRLNLVSTVIWLA